MSDIRMHVALLSVDIIDIEDKKFAQGILVFKNSVQQPKSSSNAHKQDRWNDKVGRPVSQLGRQGRLISSFDVPTLTANTFEVATYRTSILNKTGGLQH